MTGLLVIAFLVSLAVIARLRFRTYAFTAWVMVGVGAALCYPGAFQSWGGVKLTLFIVPLTQLIMFGMGTTLSPADFVRVAKAPTTVMVGVFLQFAIMPISGYVLARTFGFEGELAAGIILIGACSGGVASNLMCYLAGANVALSVTMTCFSTFLAPFITPLAMQWLAGSYLPIAFVPMMLGVFNIIIVPVVAGLIANAILYRPDPWAHHRGVMLLIAVSMGAIALFVGMSPPDQLGALAPLHPGLVLGFGLLSAIAASKLIITLWLGRGDRWMNRVLPIVSMVGICAILTILTAQTYDVLVKVGGVLIVIAVLHNTLGYVLGYWCARGAGALLGQVGHRLGWYATPASRVGERECRTVSIEVGMQNGGMATGLAITVLQSHVAALPANIFGTWMNISGSLLANYWSRKRVPEQEDEAEGASEERTGSR